MNQSVQITFDCLPLRSLGRLDPPLDAPADLAAFYARLRKAVQKHGQHNAYYLHRGLCTFHLTNDEQIGMVQFGFEGTLLTDAKDMKTLDGDLVVRLEAEVCEWLTAAGTEFLSETARHAVRVEFDRYITAGDLEKTIKRIEQLRAASESEGGFIGWGL
jgi:hypothetical protein